MEARRVIIELLSSYIRVGLEYKVQHVCAASMASVLHAALCFTSVIKLVGIHAHRGSAHLQHSNM